MKSSKSAAIFGCLLLLTTAWLITAGQLDAAEPRVEIEVVMTDRVSPAVPQEWLRLLADVGFTNPRIRNAKPGELLGVTEQGTEAAPSYRVVAKLGPDGRIQISRRVSFGRRDGEQLRSWVQELKKHGPGGPPQKGAFGFTADQLAKIKKDLGQKVLASTKDKAATDVVNRLAAGLSYSLKYEPAARTALQSHDAVAEELQGLATGTALAAILRDAGLQMRPRRFQGKYEYVVARAGRESESWPVGSKPHKRDVEVLPSLQTFQRTQEVRLPLTIAVEEMSKQIDAPVLWDHRALRKKGIDLATAEIKMRAEKKFLKRMLSGMLKQANLRFEVREDDAGTAFLWIRPNR